jgi:FkbM family methyltransferase
MNLKSAIGSLPVVGSLARWAKSRITGSYKTNPTRWISQIVGPEQATVVQIGSNDGKTGDPLHRLLMQRVKWKALFVEPVPFLFERLKRNYQGHSRFMFENSLVNDGSKVKFYWVAEAAKKANPNLPAWYDQLGGFDRGHITRHLPGVEEFIEEAELAGITMGGMLDKHGIHTLDVLHIDTEGADYKILSQLDLSRHTPQVILFERKHLSAQEQSAAVAFLRDKYEQYNLGPDILAVRKDRAQGLAVPLQVLAPYRISSQSASA